MDLGLRGQGDVMVQELTHDGSKMGGQIVGNVVIPMELATDSPDIGQVCPLVVGTLTADPDGGVTTITAASVMAASVVTASVVTASVMTASVMTAAIITASIPFTMTTSTYGLSGGKALTVGIVILEVPPQLDADGAPVAVLYVVASSVN